MSSAVIAIDGMQIRQHVDHHLAYAAPGLGSISFEKRHTDANHDAVPPVHDLEGRVDNALVAAVEMTPGSQ